MANASSSPTAMTAAPRAGAGSTDRVDADTARRAYEAALPGSRPLTGEEQERLGGLPRGHVQLLVPMFTEVGSRMLDEQRRTAVRALARTRRIGQEGVGTPAQNVRDLVIQCGALLILYRPPGPLRPRAVGAVAEGRS